MTTLIPAWIDGELTPVEKLSAHEQGLKHKAVSVFVIRDREILIQRRALGKYHTPGLWANTCCTHPNWEESSRTCAVRRLGQELSISGLDLEFRQRLEYRADVGNDLIEHEVVDVFLANADDDLAIEPNPDEVMDIRWIGYDELLSEVDFYPDRFTPWLKIYLARHADAIFGQDLLLPLSDATRGADTQLANANSAISR